MFMVISFDCVRIKHAHEQLRPEIHVSDNGNGSVHGRSIYSQVHVSVFMSLAHLFDKLHTANVYTTRWLFTSSPPMSVHKLFTNVGVDGG